jgi:hypothetical protein|tara:strand:+ start:162 stop:431 length:270 start_codon:yes stop_codon:yes gene_type:complete
MESLKERVKTKKLWGGVTLVAFGIAGLCGVEPWMAVSVLAIVWGVMGICWQHKGWQQKVEEHHHHHHNNNKKQSTNKKSGPMKKNYKRT